MTHQSQRLHALGDAGVPVRQRLVPLPDGDPAGPRRRRRLLRCWCSRWRTAAARCCPPMWIWSPIRLLVGGLDPSQATAEEIEAAIGADPAEMTRRRAASSTLSMCRCLAPAATSGHRPRRAGAVRWNISHCGTWPGCWSLSGCSTTTAPRRGANGAWGSGARRTVVIAGSGVGSPALYRSGLSDARCRPDMSPRLRSPRRQPRIRRSRRRGCAARYRSAPSGICTSEDLMELGVITTGDDFTSGGGGGLCAFEPGDDGEA